MSRPDTVEVVAQACRILGKLGLSHASLGHVSGRLDSDTMLIKAKGPDEVGLRYTRAADIIAVGFDAEKRSGPTGLQPPSESFLHIWLYRKNPAVQSVVHVHPESAVLLTICEKEIFPIYGAFGPGARMAIQGVRTYPRSVRVSNDQLGEEFATFMGDSEFCLMRGHGVAVTGSSVEDATVRAIVLDELLSMTYQAYLLGDPKPIPAEDIAAVSAAPDPDRRRGSAGGEAGTRAAWRYYRRLAGEPADA